MMHHREHFKPGFAHNVANEPAFRHFLRKNDMQDRIADGELAFRRLAPPDDDEKGAMLYDCWPTHRVVEARASVCASDVSAEGTSDTGNERALPATPSVVSLNQDDVGTIDMEALQFATERRYSSLRLDDPCFSDTNTPLASNAQLTLSRRHIVGPFEDVLRCPEQVLRCLAERAGPRDALSCMVESTI